MWSKRKVVTNIKVTSSNNNNNKPRSNLGIKWKAQNNKQNKREKWNKHTKKYLPNSVQQWPTLGKRLISPIYYRWLLYKEIQNDYTKLASTSCTRTKPNFYHFPNLFPGTRDSMISLTQGIYKCFPTQENPHQRLSTLKLPHLISQVSLSWSLLKTWSIKP